LAVRLRAELHRELAEVAAEHDFLCGRGRPPGGAPAEMALLQFPVGELFAHVSNSERRFVFCVGHGLTIATASWCRKV
jgi:hypothetical protein